MLALAHKLFVPLFALLSNIYPAVVIVFNGLGYRSSHARKNLVVYFYWPHASLDGGLRQDH
jgi:hypothetical protein